jgi:hypothetical protein
VDVVVVTEFFPSPGIAAVEERGLEGVWDHLLGDLCDPVNLAGELGGMLVLGFLWHWCGLSSPARRTHVWKTGLLEPMRGRETLQEY